MKFHFGYGLTTDKNWQHDFVKKGEVLATCYTNKEGVADILKEVHDAFEITSQPVCSLEVIHSYLR